jgi:hypothetical protein
MNNACVHIQSRHSHYKGAFRYFLSPAYGRLRLSYPTILVALFRANTLVPPPSSLPLLPLPPLCPPLPLSSLPSIYEIRVCAYKEAMSNQQKKFSTLPGYSRASLLHVVSGCFDNYRPIDKTHLCVASCNHEAPRRSERIFSLEG